EGAGYQAGNRRTAKDLKITYASGYCQRGTQASDLAGSYSLSCWAENDGPLAAHHSQSRHPYSLLQRQLPSVHLCRDMKSVNQGSHLAGSVLGIVVLRLSASSQAKKRLRSDDISSFECRGRMAEVRGLKSEVRRPTRRPGPRWGPSGPLYRRDTPLPGWPQ